MDPSEGNERPSEDVRQEEFLLDMIRQGPVVNMDVAEEDTAQYLNMAGDGLEHENTNNEEAPNNEAEVN